MVMQGGGLSDERGGNDKIMRLIMKHFEMLCDRTYIMRRLPFQFASKPLWRKAFGYFRINRLNFRRAVGGCLKAQEPKTT